MPHNECILSEVDEQLVVDAIRRAEKNTSGEIRVHIEKKTEIPPMERALEVFYFLNMQETEQKNGVLIYVAYESKKVAIIGDKGIHEVTGEDFWDSEKEQLIHHFKQEKYCDGIVKTIEQIGGKLKQYFPYRSDDTNELTDEISKG